MRWRDGERERGRERESERERCKIAAGHVYIAIRNLGGV